MSEQKSCQEFHQCLLRGTEALSEAERAHLADCEVCRLLFEEDGHLAAQLALLSSPPSVEIDAMFSQLQARLEEESHGPRKLRSLSTRWRLWVSWGVVLLLLLGLSWLKPRADLTGYPLLWMWLEVLGLSGCAAFGLWLVQRPLYRPSLARWKLVLLWGFSLGLPALFALLPVAPQGLSAAQFGGFWPTVLKCLGFGLGVTAPLLLLAWLLSPMEQLSLPVAITTALTGGLLANAALQLHCPVVNSDHLVLGHASIGLLWTTFYLAVWWIKATRKSSIPHSARSTRG